MLGRRLNARDANVLDIIPRNAKQWIGILEDTKKSAGTRGNMLRQ